MITIPFNPVTRRLILYRDEFMCVECEAYDDLQVHHIIPERDGGINEVDNGITLCRNCHTNRRNTKPRRPNKWSKMKIARKSSLYGWLIENMDHSLSRDEYFTRTHWWSNAYELKDLDKEKFIIVMKKFNEYAISIDRKDACYDLRNT